MEHKLIWHGHSNFQLASDGLNILIDPFFEGNPSCGCKLGQDCEGIEKPDVVLVTHDHGDHVGQAVEICKRTGAMLGGVVGTAGKLQSQGIPADQIMNGIGFNIGGTLEIKGAAVTMTQAHHSSESGVCVGYIITLADGFTFYHAGDTGIFSSMELYGQLHAIDLAALPIGGVFTMGPRQASVACSLLGCERVVPMHWGTFPVLEQQTDRFKRYLDQHAPETSLLEMAPGQTVILDKR